MSYDATKLLRPMEDNPYFHNALACDLFSWNIVSWSKYNHLLRDPMLEARKYEKDNLTISDPEKDTALCEERVRIWQEEDSSFDSRVCKRWHPVYPPLPRGTDMSLFAVDAGSQWASMDYDLPKEKKRPRPPSTPPPSHLPRWDQ